jgi:hypothetical protein
MMPSSEMGVRGQEPILVLMLNDRCGTLTEPLNLLEDLLKVETAATVVLKLNKVTYVK